MLIQNTKGSKNNHFRVIKNQFLNTRDIKLAVSYVQESGINILKKEFNKAIKNNVKIKLICSLDMDITSPNALRSLAEMGIQIKYYDMDKGTFHPKLWLFTKANKDKACIIGSANLTASALHHNMEIGILIDDAAALTEVEKLFSSLWNSAEAKDVSIEYLDNLIVNRQEQKRINAKKNKLLKDIIPQKLKPEAATESISKEYRDFILDFVDSWINSGTQLMDKRHGSKIGQNQLWRGWYIIPDHGLINDEKIAQLQEYCSIISDDNSNIFINISGLSKDPRFLAILSKHQKTLSRPAHKTSIRDLFVRQVSNYLKNLRLCAHPVKPNGTPERGILGLTDYGVMLASSKDKNERKRIYTAAISERAYFGIPMLETLRMILEETDYISFREFSMFIKHILAKQDIATAITAVHFYRQLSAKEQQQIYELTKSNINEKLGPKASGVLMNYEKNVRHTMSALGWCQGLVFDEDKIYRL